MDLYDPAFGPMGNLSTPISYDKNVENAQRLLNALGFGPLRVDGLLGPETSKSMQAWSATLGQSWGGTITAADVQRMQAKLKTSTATSLVASSTSTGETLASPPIKALPWLTPTMLAGGVVAVAIIGYLWWRSSQGEGLFAGEDDEKCSRVPKAFDTGEPVKVEE